MKQLVLILALVAMASPAWGKSAREEREKPRQSIQKIIKLEHTWADAVKRRDMSALSLILADDYRDTSSKGVVRNKVEEIESVRAVATNFLSYDVDELEVRVYGGVAVVTGRLIVKVLYENQQVEGRFRYTRMYVRRVGRWQAVASQMTEVPQE